MLPSARATGAAMVLPDARAELREALSELIDGRLSSDGFDDVYHRLCLDSPDEAVEAVGQFGWGLYSSDVLWPYRLTGRHAASAEQRAMAARCDQFLASELEYRWPPPQLGWVQFVQALAVAPGCLVSLFALVLVPLALSNRKWGGAGVLALIALLTLLPGLWAYRRLSRCERGRWSVYWSCGPRELWPFFSEAEFRQACSGRASF